MDRGSLRMFTPVVGETAEAISQRMGYRPKTPRAQ
jgi:hypothetical protein